MQWLTYIKRHWEVPTKQALAVSIKLLLETYSVTANQIACEAGAGAYPRRPLTLSGHNVTLSLWVLQSSQGSIFFM